VRETEVLEREGVMYWPAGDVLAGRSVFGEIEREREIYRERDRDTERERDTETESERERERVRGYNFLTRR
jgi:hypothetical protein